MATRDLDAARDLYVNVIGGTLLHEGENELLRTRSAYVAVGRDDVVEIAEPLDSGTPIADYVDANHHGLFSVWLQVEDLAGATTHLRSKAIAPSLEDGASRSSPTPPPRTACTGASPPHRSRTTPAPTGSQVQSPSASAASSARKRWSSRARKCGDT